jgi:hypothetical protein
MLYHMEGGVRRRYVDDAVDRIGMAVVYLVVSTIFIPLHCLMHLADVNSVEEEMHWQNMKYYKLATHLNANASLRSACPFGDKLIPPN